MTIELISKRRMRKAELEELNEARYIASRGLSRREVIKAMAGASLLTSLPLFGGDGLAQAGGLVRTIVKSVDVLEDVVQLGKKISSAIEAFITSKEPKEVPIYLAYKLPSGLIGKQTSEYIILDPKYIYTIKHGGFSAMEVGDSRYIARLDNFMHDDFEVIS